jgi:TolA-binding protein
MSSKTAKTGKNTCCFQVPGRKLYPFLVLALAAVLCCTTYRTYNSLHWAKEAYKQGMRTKEDQERQRRRRNPNLSRSEVRGVMVPGAQFFEEAARKCLAFLAQAPEGRRSDDALMLMGKAFFELRRFIQAESSLQKLLDTQKKSKFRDDAQYYLILINLEQDDPSLAELAIERLLDEYPKSKYRSLAQFHLGRTYFELENYQLALEVLSGVRDNYPKFKLKGEVLSYLARIHFEVEDFEKALPFYEELYKKGKNNELKREGIIGMARCKSRLDKHEEALQLYEEALSRAKFDDERAEASLGRDVEYTFLNQAAEAMKDLEKIVLDNPRTEYSAAAWYELGLIYKDYSETAGLDSIEVDSSALVVFGLNSKRLEPLVGLSQRLLSYRLAEMAFRNMRREDPYSLLLEPGDQFIEDVQNLYSIYEQIEASDSATSRDALARLEFLLAEHHENTGEIELARAGYERVILQYANTIWVPKAALNIATTSAQLGDSTRYRQSLELVVDNFPDTRYADRARRLLGFPVPERPPGFYLDELAAYTPPKIRRKEAAAIGGAAKAGAPGQETWLQMRRRLWRNRFGTSGGGA